MKTTLANVTTFIASVAVGCGAAIAIASAAALTHAAPMLRPAAEVIRMEPVVVTVSTAHYEAVRRQYAEEAAVARADAKKVARG